MLALGADVGGNSTDQVSNAVAEFAKRAKLVVTNIDDVRNHNGIIEIWLIDMKSIKNREL